MTLEVRISDDLGATLGELVSQGEFASVDEAAEALIRRGLARGGGRPARPDMPPPPPPAPGRREPADDRPIQPEPTDTNWMK